MFGRKKKEEKLPITHNVLGDIVIEPFVRTVNSYEISLFGRKYTFYLYVNSSEFKGKGSFTTEQERTIAFFISNLSDIEKSLENQLKCFFECDDYSAFINSIILENITISSDGELAAFFNSNFSDEELASAKSNAYFTETFGIIIYPKEQVLYNEEECYKFDS